MGQQQPQAVKPKDGSTDTFTRKQGTVGLAATDKKTYMASEVKSSRQSEKLAL